MNSKVIAVFTFLCVMQGIDSKAFMNPFFAAYNPMMMPMMPMDPMDAQLRPLVADIQMRLTQLNSVSKQAIGMRVGQASQNIGMLASASKANMKLQVSAMKNLPVAKECKTTHKTSIDQLQSRMEMQNSMCTKTAQMQVKQMSQIQKMNSIQINALNSETNMCISQCKLESPMPTDVEQVKECVSGKADLIREKVATLEQEMMSMLEVVEAGVTENEETARNCNQQVTEQMQGEVDSITQQLNACNAMYPTVL